MDRLTLLLVRAVLLLAASATVPRATADDPPIDFDRDIRPILSQRCSTCHGPDQNKRKADLRLDTRDGAFAERDGERVIVPGDPARSELFRRVTAADEDERMPPTSSGPRLTEKEIGNLRRWIEAGAQWRKHWSFIAPRRPPLPLIRDAGLTRNEIDFFILSRLEAEGLSLSPEASRQRLLRRVTLDLTGLPPTPGEVDAFLADSSPGAYDRVVARLLGSPRHGERLATTWLDAARYADTSGYQNDGPRHMWRWRDWVIEAFNNGVPFDRFTVEQLAGDMLPGATLQQRIATGFNRNHRGNAEGGIIAAEFQVEYVVDRVDTTSTVWLGLTLKCARCHEHKYDPISQEEFYRVYAYFNNVPEKGRAIKEGNSVPVLAAPTREQRRSLHALGRQLAAARETFDELRPELARARSAWERSLPQAPLVPWTIARDLRLHLPLDRSTGVGDATDPSREVRLHSGLSGTGKVTHSSGRVGDAIRLDGTCSIEAGDVGNFGYFDKLSLTAWIFPEDTADGAIISRTADPEFDAGYEFRLHNGHLQVNLVKRWLDDAIRIQTRSTLEAGRWYHVAMTYDGSRVASGITITIDGLRQEIEVLLDEINQSFASAEPLRVGSRGTGSHFQGLIDDARVYGRTLSEEDLLVLATPDSIPDIAAIPGTRRSAGQALKIHRYFLKNHAPDAIRRVSRHAVELEQRRDALLASVPTIMVMEEMEPPRQTHILLRGQYDKPGARVDPGTPATLPPLPAGVQNNRLGFARWIVDPSNPLTSRVTVNRFWQMIFGVGLVKTTEDFGTQGSRASHPDLLDWLATDFIRRGWSVKALLRTMLTSATYRQVSRVTPALLAQDPENRLLGRSPRYRLSAHMVRDQALAVSGLLVERLHGPSVKPYQPAGLWKEIAGLTYTPDHGEGLYRRSLYTYWKRTAAPPSMMVLDASDREWCSVRQRRTNTPLQALTLLNEITFVEAARALAERVMQRGVSPEEGVGLLFRLATARRPASTEREVLLAGHRHHLARYRQDRKAALDLLAVGEHPRNATLDVAELAAWTATANLILNLDETITRG